MAGDYMKMCLAPSSLKRSPAARFLPFPVKKTRLAYR